MAVATTLTDITDAYTLVASTGGWTTIQVVGVSQVDVHIVASGGTAPTTANGFILRVLDAMTPDSWGDGDVYIKTRSTGLLSKVATLTV